MLERTNASPCPGPGEDGVRQEKDTLVNLNALENLMTEYLGLLPEGEKRYLRRMICGQVEILIHDLLRRLAD
ncbi:hypothetical protein [Neomoorella thermoacetica]|uniref:hypothetical protein n=1 Tax=Neomoorella thermoacetica TaxID=1525 RepID=UPI000039B1EF|nr:hypothetical protein [Moorella thermoacetica]AKX94269.1 hypothetical protein MOTHE_c14760 [Moorella thermoacetica]AKX96907.1 hypothetical protein MOTHA_c15610 [Moorella thermoacetica]OIQ54382.1 hypothetical protein MORE_13510 [Moorella thermoacetica]OIQ58078.1 hypothetical protein MOCA_05030 [Moorella thermoacetica]QDA00737.1 hypothetical protein MothHH_01598 [Moorella thermoacetica]